MQRYVFGLLGIAVCSTLIGCSSPTTGSVKEQLYAKPGEKLAPGADEQWMMSFVGINDAGQINNNLTYPAHLEGDGAFRVVASNGEVPPGKYRVACEVEYTKSTTKQGRPLRADRFGGKYSKEKSPLTVEVKLGENDFPIELGEVSR